MIALSNGLTLKPCVTLTYKAKTLLQLISSQSLNLYEWYFLTFTFDGIHARIFVNGKLTAELEYSFRMQTLKRIYCYIGKSNWPEDGYSHSFLDDLKFSNKSLTNEEILSIMNQSGNETEKNLTHYWPISESEMKDVKNSADMTQEGHIYYIEDRFGNEKSALALNGAWTQIPSGVYFNTTEITISVWIYPQQIETNSIIFSFGNDSTNFGRAINFLLNGQSTRPYFSSYSKHGSFEVLSKESLVLDEWQFLSFTFNGTHARMYLNGQILTELIENFNFKLDSLFRTTCNIGLDVNFANKIEYKNSWLYLDDLRFYNKSLAKEEINEIFVQNRTGTN